MDGAFVVCGWTHNVGTLGLFDMSKCFKLPISYTYTIVEASSRDMRKLKGH
jgi:hypothetical protein